MVSNPRLHERLTASLSLIRLECAAPHGPRDSRYAHVSSVVKPYFLPNDSFNN